jgi:hypothetical protein
MGMPAPMVRALTRALRPNPLRAPYTRARPPYVGSPMLTRGISESPFLPSLKFAPTGILRTV